jgi:RNA polymerase sigma-70 factor (ECF subfamily)
LKSEADLIKRLKSTRHKEEAFRELLDLYQERLYWHIRKIVVRHEDADDVLQNTFLRVFKGINGFKAESSLHTWMYRIAYNESIRFLEKNRQKDLSLLDPSEYREALTEDDHFDGDEIKLKLHQVISELSEKQQRVFQMKYFDDLSFRQISELLDISENTLKSAYYAAVKIIEERMISQLV